MILEPQLAYKLQALQKHDTRKALNEYINIQLDSLNKELRNAEGTEIYKLQGAAKVYEALLELSDRITDAIAEAKDDIEIQKQY